MEIDMSRFRSGAWRVPPTVFAAALAAIFLAWTICDPAGFSLFFDNDGRSPFQMATVPVFAAIVPAVWIFRPFSGSRWRRAALCTAVSVVAIMAIVKELDLHCLALNWLYPDFVGEGGGLVHGKLFKPNGSPLTGTPFKMRVLTNSGVPLGMKAAVLFYFTAFFGVFGAGLLRFFPRWIKGVFRFEPASWSFGCFGASGVVVQIADRLPAWLGHGFGLDKHSSLGASPASALCTAIEEGFEMMIAVFAIMTIVFAWRDAKRERFKQSTKGANRK
jgi:hypothetical protein